MKSEPLAGPVNREGWGYGIYTTADLAMMLEFSRDEALRMFSVTLGPGEIAEALREARAPEPWQNPNSPIAVGRIDNFCPVGMTRAFREVRAALRKLQRYLPNLIKEFEEEINLMDDPEHVSILSVPLASSRALHEDHLARFRKLKSLSNTIANELPLGKGPTAAWRDDAERLYQVYQEIVGRNSGISADGPAVRFIQIGLKRLTEKEHEKNAIETALRYRKIPASRSR